ncbi:MAG: LytTR family DNA-binding domain-containing protein [Bacteroidales bacterium]
MKVYQHILFWVLVYTSLTLIFGDWFQGYSDAFYYVSLLMPVVMGTSYFFNYFLVPRYLFPRKFFSFVLYSLYMLIISVCLEMVACVLAMIIMLNYGINEHPPLFTDVFTLAIILYFIVLAKSFLLLIKHYFVDQSAIARLETEKTRMEAGHFTIRADRKTHRIDYDRVRYVESLADYVKIHLEDGASLVSKEKISHLEEQLPEMFLRIHRSFLVHSGKITHFTREEVQVGEEVLPVSRSYRPRVMSVLQKESAS